GEGSGANCKEITGAAAQTYVPTSSDVGHTIEVKETASNGGGPGEPATSAPTATVAATPVPVNSAPPTITGTDQQGRTLTEVHGTWTNEPTSFAYQWLLCEGSGANCKEITGAAAQTYVPTSSDVGHTIEVKETASNGGGPGESATSAPTATVAKAPVPDNTSALTITVTVQQGHTLTEHHGTWTNEPTSFSYQWLQCDGIGLSCLPI